MRSIIINTIFSVFLLFYNLNYAQESNSLIIYKKKVNSNLEITKNNLPKNPTANLIVENAYKNLDNLAYKLSFNKELSIFTENESLEIDNLNNEISVILSKSFGETEGTFFTMIKTQNLLLQKELDSRIFLIKMPFSEFNWAITSIQKKIGNYTCYKATMSFPRTTVSGIKQIPVVAYFTPEIPYSYGPARYVGLPGLVLEAEVDNIIIYASKIILNKTEKEVIEVPKKGKLISENEFNELTKNAFEQFKKFN